MSDVDDELQFIKKQLENIEYYKLGYNAAQNKLYTAQNKLYTAEEVLQLLLMLQQTESYDSLYEWFKQFKK